MDKEQLSELVFASETLQKNLDEFKKLGDFGEIVKNLRGVEHLSTELIKKHIENVDWNSIVKKATTDSEKAFLENNNRLIETVKSYEKAQKKAEEAIKTVDMKVLHETANQTEKILKQQKRIKIRSIIFTSFFSFLFMLISIIFAAKPVVDLYVDEKAKNVLQNKGFVIFEDNKMIQISTTFKNSTVFETGNHKVIQLNK